MTLEVKSDMPYSIGTFASKFDVFETDAPVEENVVIHHHFSSVAQPISFNRANNRYFRPPWAVYQDGEKWIYQWIKKDPPYTNYYQTVITDREHTLLHIHNDEAMKNKFLHGGLESLTMFPTDQILLGRLLAYRDGCIMHSLGIIMDGHGYLFVGHSDAGKSTVANKLKKDALILCDDRNVIRKKGNDYILSGTWSHGDVPNVSSQVAPLKAIFFLKQAADNELEPVTDEAGKFQALLACLIRPLETRDWWEKTLDFLTNVSRDVPCWELAFTKDCTILDLIKNRAVIHIA